MVFGWVSLAKIVVFPFTVKEIEAGNATTPLVQPMWKRAIRFITAEPEPLVIKCEAQGFHRASDLTPPAKIQAPATRDRPVRMFR